MDESTTQNNQAAQVSPVEMPYLSKKQNSMITDVPEEGENKKSSPGQEKQATNENSVHKNLFVKTKRVYKRKISHRTNTESLKDISDFHKTPQKRANMRRATNIDAAMQFRIALLQDTTPQPLKRVSSTHQESVAGEDNSNSLEDVNSLQTPQKHTYTCQMPEITIDNQFSSNAKQQDAQSQSQSGKFNEGRWTEDEHKRFLQALKLYGRNWNQVHQHIGTRSSAQTRSHAQKYFNKLISKGVYSSPLIKTPEIAKHFSMRVGQSGEMNIEKDSESNYNASMNGECHTPTINGKDKFRINSPAQVLNLNASPLLNRKFTDIQSSSKRNSAAGRKIFEITKHDPSVLRTKTEIICEGLMDLIKESSSPKLKESSEKDTMNLAHQQLNEKLANISLQQQDNSTARASEKNQENSQSRQFSCDNIEEILRNNTGQTNKEDDMMGENSGSAPNFNLNGIGNTQTKQQQSSKQHSQFQNETGQNQDIYNVNQINNINNIGQINNIANITNINHINHFQPPQNSGPGLFYNSATMFGGQNFQPMSGFNPSMQSYSYCSSGHMNQVPQMSGPFQQQQQLCKNEHGGELFSMLDDPPQKTFLNQNILQDEGNITNHFNRIENLNRMDAPINSINNLNDPLGHQSFEDFGNSDNNFLDHPMY